MFEKFSQALQRCATDPDRCKILDKDPRVLTFFASEHPWREKIELLRGEEAIAVKQLIAIGQLPDFEISDQVFKTLVGQLVAVDRFYREMGGVSGYQAAVLRLLGAENTAIDANVTYHSPSFVDISSETDEVVEMIERGIDALPFFCEIYPLGGAADRLHLIDEKTRSELPAAKLEFAGSTLLARLLADLQAREQLYFQRTGKKVIVPIAIMTSLEKENHRHIVEILEANNYFGRPKEKVKLFMQPLVPAVNEKGLWQWKEDGSLLLKPGGHGAIWKQALDSGVFRDFRALGIKYALVRQINNPLAGLDYGLLAFSGIGVFRKMSFGFASCPRVIGAAEGVNVLIRRKGDSGYAHTLSNIEYCDFSKFGIEDLPLHPNDLYSRFTSNTNILFANLVDLEEAVNRCPFPGMIMNLKKVPGKQEAIGRLELTMQNIADAFIEKSKDPKSDLKRVFVTCNVRHKTISTAKKALGSSGHAFNETPENCFYDLLRAHRELLRDYCGFNLPLDKTLQEVLASHPPFVFLYSALLGPQFRRIAEKLQRGSFKDGSELRLDLAQAAIDGLELDGSLRIIANSPLNAKCTLKQVKVLNAGVDWSLSKPFWKGCYQRKESLTIILEGKSEFIAENITFKGNREILVRDGEVLNYSSSCV